MFLFTYRIFVQCMSVNVCVWELVLLQVNKNESVFHLKSNGYEKKWFLVHDDYLTKTKTEAMEWKGQKFIESTKSVTFWPPKCPHRRYQHRFLFKSKSFKILTNKLFFENLSIISNFMLKHNHQWSTILTHLCKY